jgi:hypothetical protein
MNHEEICRAFLDRDSTTAEELLQHLTTKFSKLLEALKFEELEKKML